MTSFGLIAMEQDGEVANLRIHSESVVVIDDQVHVVGFLLTVHNVCGLEVGLHVGKPASGRSVDHKVGGNVLVLIVLCPKERQGLCVAVHQHTFVFPCEIIHRIRIHLAEEIPTNVRAKDAIESVKKDLRVVHDQATLNQINDLLAGLHRRNHLGVVPDCVTHGGIDCFE